MKVDKTKFNLSLDDTYRLRKLITENPKSPLLIFAGEEAWSGEYSYEMTRASKGAIKYLTIYNDYWMEKEDYKEQLLNDLDDNEEYKNLTDEEFERKIDSIVENTTFCKVIVIYVG